MDKPKLVILIKLVVTVIAVGLAIGAQVGVTDAKPKSIFDITVARHVDTATDGNAAAKYAAGSLLLQTDDKVCSDVVCCVELNQSGLTTTFGVAGDGGDVITSQAELNAAFAVASHTKVVTSASNCCGWGGTILGCTRTGTRNVVMVANAPADVWVHEFGHTKGLPENDACNRLIMHPSASNTDAVTASERNSFEANPDRTGAPCEWTCIAYILDRSGSMYGWPLAVAKLAANIGITLMREQDEVAVVSFNHYSSVNYSRHAIASDAVRQAARTAVNGLSSTGYTSIGAGLLEGYNQLLTSKAKTRNYLLLSDGMENTPPWARDILPLFQNLIPSPKSPPIKMLAGAEEEVTHHIHSIAFGPGADQVLLSELASATGGIFLFSPTVTDPLALSDIFFTIQGEVSGEQRFASHEGDLTVPMSESISYFVGPDVAEETATLMWNSTGHELSLSLERPDGLIVNAGNWQTFPGVTRTEGPGVEYYTTADPMEGDWIAHITTNSGSVSYALILSGVSSILMDVAFDRDAYPAGTPIVVTATLTEGTDPILGASVTAQVQTPTSAAAVAGLAARNRTRRDSTLSEPVNVRFGPDGKTWVDSEGTVLYQLSDITLFDDGAHGDGAPNDGVYGASFTDTHVQGSYTFRLAAAGVAPSGQRFGREATRSTVVTTVTNLAPEITGVDPDSQTVRYSDAITPVTITATDPDGDPLTLSANPLPGALALKAVSASTWVLSGQMLQAAGIYNIALTANDGQLDSAPRTLTIVVEPEVATVALDDANPIEVQVAAPGGDSQPFSLRIHVAEFDDPNDSQGDSNLAGDISLAGMTVLLVPVGPGQPMSPVGCARTIDPGTPDPDSPYDYDLATFECAFDHVPVNAYTVAVEVNASGFYLGDEEGVLVVSDPSLGFVTGGGHFCWPGTENLDLSYPGDRTNCGFQVKHTGRGDKAKGSLLIIRHMADGTLFRVKSNAMLGLAVGSSKDAGGDFGWASFVGKATCQPPWWPEPVGSYEFTAYVEDRGEPGSKEDRFWVEVRDRDKIVDSDFSFAKPALVNAVTIAGGNIAVPHSPGPQVQGTPRELTSEPAELPNVVMFERSSPNPFKSETSILFRLPQPMHVRLVIYDMAGREVARLVDETMPAGHHVATWKAAGLPSGVYAYRIQAGSSVETGRIVLLK